MGLGFCVRGAISVDCWGFMWSGNMHSFEAEDDYINFCFKGGGGGGGGNPTSNLRNPP